MKRIPIDTNFNWLGPDRPALSNKEVSDLGLKSGEKVLAYQDDDEWNGVVCFDPELPESYRWYIRLESL